MRPPRGQPYTVDDFFRLARLLSNQLQCEGCSLIYQDGMLGQRAESEAEVNTAARVHGWVVNKNYAWCPTCQQSEAYGNSDRKRDQKEETETNGNK
jgi:hypothetical protein